MQMEIDAFRTVIDYRSCRLTNLAAYIDLNADISFHNLKGKKV